MLVVDCGYATSTDDHTYWNKDCGPTGFPCPPTPTDPAPHQFITTTALTDPPVAIAQWCAGVDDPLPSAADLRAELIRLLQPQPLGVSPATGTTLVNLKTLFWVRTASERDLGRAALIGFPVQLRVSYVRTEFDFGDGTTGSLQPGPGSPYDPAEDCGSCADRFGHSYLSAGSVTVTARTYWHAAYRIDGQQWIALPGDVTAVAPTTVPLTIVQAHSELVDR